MDGTGTGQQFESKNAVESYINQKGALMNKFDETLKDPTGRDQAERQLETVRLRGGMFVEAVRVTRMPMMVTDATLPGILSSLPMKPCSSCRPIRAMRCWDRTRIS
ncbi:hypothetical protein [Sphingomonas sp. LB2R24]|uniref:hypothetical protein n=1 Tax=Sphingomonas sorbitolis TaxID=3096165 RepID=UPI002FC78F61